MQHEIAALEHSIIHLLQTNAEIREEHDVEDPELKLAVEENTTVYHPENAHFPILECTPFPQYTISGIPFFRLLESDCIALEIVHSTGYRYFRSAFRSFMSERRASNISSWNYHKSCHLHRAQWHRRSARQQQHYRQDCLQKLQYPVWPPTQPRPPTQPQHQRLAPIQLLARKASSTCENMCHRIILRSMRQD